MKKLFLVTVLAVMYISGFAGVYGLDCSRGVSNCSTDIDLPEEHPFTLYQRHNGLYFKVYAECTSSGTSDRSAWANIYVSLRGENDSPVAGVEATADPYNQRVLRELRVDGDDYSDARTLIIKHRVVVPAGIYGSIRTSLVMYEF